MAPAGIRSGAAWAGLPVAALRAVVSARTWLAVIHLLSGWFIGLAAFIIIAVTVPVGFALLVVALTGIVVLWALLLLCGQFARAERRRFAVLWPDVGVLVLSQYVEERYATELLSGGPQGVGYLLKDRVADLAEFLGALDRVAAGGSALDPEVVSQLLARSRHPLATLTAREREVLALMAEGRTNTAIAATLFVGEGAVEKHINSIFAKLGLAPAHRDHRRVLAVLRYLGAD